MLLLLNAAIATAAAVVSAAVAIGVTGAVSPGSNVQRSDNGLAN